MPSKNRVYVPKTRVHFDTDVQPLVDNILIETGLKSYTEAVNLMIKKYGKDFIHSYNRFITEADLPTPQTQIQSLINLKSLESFNGQ